MECKIFLASLTAHTNGIIDGVWIDLTDDNAMDKIKAFKDARGGQEFFIGDSMASVSMDIGEYDDPYELFKFVYRLKDLDETQLDAYETIMNALGFERKEVLERVENWEFDAIEWNSGNIEEAVGYYFAELSGWLDYDDTLHKYFDYERFGRDICVNSEVCENGETIFVLR